jgi:c-di-GMP-related signal transduction protein
MKFNILVPYFQVNIEGTGSIEIIVNYDLNISIKLLRYINSLE